MTFPSSKFTSAGDFCDAYFTETGRATASVDRARVAEACALLGEAMDGGARIYVCGNGGSAAISNHLVCDHLKGIQTDTDRIPRVVSLSANIELITAIANDITYDDVFVYQLRSLAEPGDVLITVSSSGNSENIVRAIDWAASNNLRTIAMTGFDGGRSATAADINLHVEGDNYGVVEDVHQSLMHILAQYLRQEKMTEALVGDRKF